MHMPLVLTNRRRRGGSASAPAFSPSTLYSSGSQGVWYDPSDLSTMFSDRAGTIQVTTPGTVVGKRLDKSGRGNHAVAPTDAARPIYGVEPKGGRRNLLTWSEGFDNAAWVKATSTLTHLPSEVDPFGNIGGVYRLQIAGGATGSITQALVLNWAVANNIAFYVKQNGVLSSKFRLLLAGNQLSSDFTATTSWARYQFSATRAIADSRPSGLNNPSDTTAVDILVWGAQLELGSTATAYQRVNSAYDITESGVATCHYVQYDGSDDSMFTSAIDFTATDKMSVFAGVRKLSDAASNMIAEFGNPAATSVGTFTLSVPLGATDYFFASAGSVRVGTQASGFAAPISNVITGLGDISGDRVTLRANSAQVAQSTVDQGTGNFGNYSMYFGRRANISLPFNGKDYGIIVVGKAASAGEISDTELWLSDKTAEVDVAKSISPNIYTRSGDTILDRANSIIERRTV